MSISIRRRIFLSYIALILLVVGYVAVSGAIRSVRLRIETDRNTILQLKNTWNQIQISLNNIVVNWRDGASYEEFRAQYDAFDTQLAAAHSTISGRVYYPQDLKKRLTNLEEVWSIADTHLSSVVRHVELPAFAQVEHLVTRKPGLQRLNHLWVDLFYSGSAESRRLAYVIEDLIASVEFFPIYGETMNHLLDVIIGDANRLHAQTAVFQRAASFLFFVAFLITAFFLSSRFSYALSRPIVRVADRLSRFMGRTGAGSSYHGRDEVRVLARTAEHMMRHYTRLSTQAERLARGEVADGDLDFPRSGVVGHSMSEIANYFYELARTSDWIRMGQYGAQIKEKSPRDVLAHNFNVMSAVIYEQITTLRNMFEGVDEAVLVMDENGTVLEANSRLFRLFGDEGCESAECERILQELPPKLSELVVQVVGGTSANDYHTTLRALAGHEVPVRINGRLLPQLDGQRQKVMFLISNESWRARAKREQERLRAHATVAELKALRAQIHPHFFFNTLNTIAYLIETQPETAVGTVEKLADLFRYTLAATRRDRVPLREELEQIERYLDIEKLRHRERLTVTYNLDGGLETARIPPMLLQPLVENAVRYGQDGRGSVRIEIHARKEREAVSIEIADHGAAEVSQDELLSGSGTGIRNVNHRLKTLYREQLYFRDNTPAGLVVGLRIPARAS